MIASAPGPSPEELIAYGLEHAWVHQAAWNGLAEPDGLRVFVKGQGCFITDIHGREILDGMSGAWVVNVGHGRREIGQAMAQQAETLAYTSAFNFLNIPSIELSRKLAAITPAPLNRVFLSNSGAEAVEAALAMARQYHFNHGHKGRYKVISRRGSYHGSTFGGKSLSGFRHGVLQARFAPLLEGALHVAGPNTYRPDDGLDVKTHLMRCAREIERVIQHEGAESVAAVIGETISASAGVHIPDAEYWQTIRDICDRYGVLLILDEVLVGMGRTGKMFAFEHFGVVPDMLTLSKGVASGYAPIGALVVTDKVGDAFKGDANAAFAHGCTYGNHAVTCAASLANIDILEREDLPGNAARMGQHLRERLEALRHQHPSIGDIRQIGLLCALELVHDRASKTPFPASAGMTAKMYRYLLDECVFVRVTDVIQIAPPLIASTAEIDHLVEALSRAIGRFEQELGMSA